MVLKIVLLCNGESEWNAEGLFAGWQDIDLSAAGKKEAQEAGKCLKEKGLFCDVVFTSKLKRAVCTAWLALMEADHVSMPVLNSWRLNDRQYGDLEGASKAEAEKEHGKDRVEAWCCGYDACPPPVTEYDERHPCNDPQYANVPKRILPCGESVQASFERVLPYWFDQIGPCVQGGRTVLVVAHGNTLRAIGQHLEGLSPAQAMDLKIPRAVPLVYELDNSMKFVRKYYLMDDKVVSARLTE